jgi:hypothetical protein
LVDLGGKSEKDMVTVFSYVDSYYSENANQLSLPPSSLEKISKAKSKPERLGFIYMVTKFSNCSGLFHFDQLKFSPGKVLGQ